MVWRKKKLWQTPKIKVKYPKFTYVKCEDNGKYYIILDKTKKEYISQDAFKSWGVKPLNTSLEAISHYYLYGKKGFRPGSLLRSVFDQKLYMAGEELLHAVKTTEVFDLLGYSKDDIYVVSEEIIDFYEKGDDLVGFSL